MLPKEGPLRLSGFSEARIGLGPYDYLAMSTSYRTPEITLIDRFPSNYVHQKKKKEKKRLGNSRPYK